MAKNVNLKLDDVKDADIIEFLEGKGATTFLFKEAIRMYIKAYKRLDEVTEVPGMVMMQQPAPQYGQAPSNEVKSSLANMGKRIGKQAPRQP